MTTVAYIEDRSWKVIIKNSDGTTNDILLLPIPSKDPEKTGEKEVNEHGQDSFLFYQTDIPSSHQKRPPASACS
jgi:hypothetical protein